GARAGQAGDDEKAAAKPVDAVAGEQIAGQMGQGVQAHHQADEARGGAQRDGEGRQHRILGVQVEKRDEQEQIKPDGGFHARSLPLSLGSLFLSLVCGQGRKRTAAKGMQTGRTPSRRSARRNAARSQTGIPALRAGRPQTTGSWRKLSARASSGWGASFISPDKYDS